MKRSPAALLLLIALISGSAKSGLAQQANATGLNNNFTVPGNVSDQMGLEPMMAENQTSTQPPSPKPSQAMNETNAGPMMGPPPPHAAGIMGPIPAQGGGVMVGPPPPQGGSIIAGK